MYKAVMHQMEKTDGRHCARNRPRSSSRPMSLRALPCVGWFKSLQSVIPGPADRRREDDQYRVVRCWPVLQICHSYSWYPVWHVRVLWVADELEPLGWATHDL